MFLSYLGCKAVYGAGLCRKDGLTLLDNDEKFVEAVELYALVRWSACSGVVGKSLHQVPHACIYVWAAV